MVARKLLIASLVCLQTACTATYSFAPPEVDLARPSSPSALNCDRGLTATAVKPKSGPSDGFGRDVDGAISLAENFVVAYRCAARQLADGRQDFEVPAALSLLGGTTAAALGAAPAAAIATGTTSAMLNAGKSYYDPAAKLVSVRSAQNAAVCVFSIASGAAAYQIKQDATRARLLKADLMAVADANIRASDAFKAQQELASIVDTRIRDDNARYYGEVYGALLSIDAILGERLATAGRIDLEAIKAALKKLPDPPPAPDGRITNLENRDLKGLADSEVDFTALHTSLQECVLRARV